MIPTPYQSDEGVMEPQKLDADVEAYPILYTDVLMDGTDKSWQVCRGDMWAVSTSELNRLTQRHADREAVFDELAKYVSELPAFRPDGNVDTVEFVSRSAVLTAIDELRKNP